MAGLDLCSVCKKGYLRPTGEVATDAEAYGTIQKDRKYEKACL